MKKHIRTLLSSCILVTVVTMGAGCEKGAGKPSLSSTSTPVTQPEIALALPKQSDQQTPAVVSMEKVWNQNAIQTIDARLPDHTAWLPMGIDEQGTFLATIPSQKGHPVAQLALYSTGSGKTEVIASLNGQSQAAASDLNEKWVVWTEVLDQSMANWRIHVYDRTAHTDRIVAESPHDTSGNGFPGPIVSPKLNGDEFVWSQPTGPQNQPGSKLVIERYNNTTGNTTRVADGGNPILTDTFTVWEGSDETTHKGALFWNKGGATQQITQGRPIVFFATDGNGVAWSSVDSNTGQSPKWSIGLIDEGTERVLFSTEESDALQYLTLSPRIVAWTAYQNVQVYDRKLDKIVTLSNKDAGFSSVYTNEHYLYWTSPIPQTDAERMQARQNGVMPAKIHLVNLEAI